MKKLFLTFVSVMLALASVHAQDNFRQEYEKFRNQAITAYSDFRKECNDKYVEFLKYAWESYHATQPLIEPEDKEVPPVVIDDKRVPVIENRKLGITEIVPIPSPGPRPQPLSPIPERPAKPSDNRHGETGYLFAFDFYGTDMCVRAGDGQKFELKSYDRKSVSAAWKKLSGIEYDDVLYDCLKVRDDYKLCDWAYLQMIFAFSDSFLGRGNASTLLAAYIYSQSGYKMRLGSSDRGLELLYCSDYQIYGAPCFNLGGGQYYQYNGKDTELKIVDFSFPREQPMSLSIDVLPEFEVSSSEPRTLASAATGDIVSGCVNRNLLDFYASYPSSQINDNPITRWAVYANTPLDPAIKAGLYPQLEKKMSGKSKAESVNVLLNFVQTAFVYEYDDKIWGADRAFFAEETLYYPYCDCEDRSILFSRLVRDLLGLDVILVYYPGHLATAVSLPDDVTGDYIILKGSKYIICDPTYIGAPAGATMPDMDNTKAKVILLN